MRIRVLFTLLLTSCGISADAPRQYEPVTSIAEANDYKAEVGNFDCPESIEELAKTASLNMKEGRLYDDDLVVVLKKRRRVLMYSHGVLQVDPLTHKSACWKIALGHNRLGKSTWGRKVRTGDRLTPEGWYRLSEKPDSQLRDAIAVHYPNQEDADLGRELGIITDKEYRAIQSALQHGKKPPQYTGMGGDVLFHAGGTNWDWTEGCIALGDDDHRVFRDLLPPNLDLWALLLP